MKKILVADSINDTRETIMRALESHGLHCTGTGKGRDVIQIDHDEVMLVVIAHHLQDISAFDVIEEVIRENPYFSEIPFIITTSDNSNAFFRRATSKGFTDVLYRPFSRKTLFNMVKNILVEKEILDSDMFMGMGQVEEILEKERVDFLRYILAQPNSELIPKYNPKVGTGYYYPRATEFFAINPGEEYSILTELTDENVFTKKLVDKVNICPRCSFHTLNYREICPKCKSLDIEVEEIFHHFHCGYVGPSMDFHTEGAIEELICPKCEKRLRHIGMDYEKPSDTFVCGECKYVFIEPDVDFKCFNCGFNGDANSAIITMIYSFLPTRKAEKVVEANSFSIFSFEDLILMDNRNCYNMDFFKFMLKRSLNEVKELGNSATVILIGIQDITDTFLNNFISAVSPHISNLEIMSMTDKRRIVILFPAFNEEKTIGVARKIRESIYSLGKEKKVFPDFGILIRSLKEENFSPDPGEFIKEMTTLYDSKFSDSKGEIFSYDED